MQMTPLCTSLISASRAKIRKQSLPSREKMQLSIGPVDTWMFLHEA